MEEEGSPAIPRISQERLPVPRAPTRGLGKTAVTGPTAPDTGKSQAAGRAVHRLS